MKNKRGFLLFFLLSGVAFTYISTQKREIFNKDIVENKRESISLPQGTEWLGGIFTGIATFLLQQKYTPDLFKKIQKMMSDHAVIGNKTVWDGISYLPTLAVGGYFFYQIYRITPSGLYNRALKIFNEVEQYESAKTMAHSIVLFKENILTFGTAKEKATLFASEHEHVVAYKFLCNLLLKLTYAERLLERALYWVQNPGLQAQIESLKFDIGKKLKIVLNNKSMYKKEYYSELADYREDEKLANEDKIAEIAEGNHTLNKIKFMVKVTSKILKIVWVPVKAVILLPFKAGEK